MLLSEILMRQIFDSFQSGLTSHTRLIQSRLGTPWQRQLDQCPTTMWQKTLPVNLILCCMVDTMIVLSRVMTRWSRLTGPLYRRRSYTASEIELACSWYLQKQAAIHTRIGALLAKDGSPKEKSIATLHIELVEVIEFGLRSMSDDLTDITSSVAGVARDVGRGATAAILGGSSVVNGLQWGATQEVRRGVFDVGRKLFG